MFDYLVFSRQNLLNQLKQSRQTLTKELDDITNRIELLETKKSDTSNYDTKFKLDEEIQHLLKLQNVLSYDVLQIRKKIKKLQNKAFLMAELLVFPSIVLLLIFTLVL